MVFEGAVPGDTLAVEDERRHPVLHAFFGVWNDGPDALSKGVERLALG